MWIKRKLFFFVVARTGRSFPRYTHPYWEHNYCVLLFLTLPVEPKTEQSALQNDVSFFQSTELGFFQLICVFYTYIYYRRTLRYLSHSLYKERRKSCPPPTFPRFVSDTGPAMRNGKNRRASIVFLLLQDYDLSTTH